MKPLTNIGNKLLSSVLIFIITGVLEVAAQEKYWVYLIDKPIQTYDYQEHLSVAAIDKRKLLHIPLKQYTDIPMNANYLQAIREYGIAPIVNSKWLNAASCYLTADQVKWLSEQDFVLRIERINRNLDAMTSSLPPPSAITSVTDYSLALAQMQPKAMEAAKLNGAGVVIGVIDAGFFGAKKREGLKHIFDENRVLGIKDWVNPNKTKHYEEVSTFSDWHGAEVLEMIAGHNTKTQKVTGFASKASFYLARTDDGNHEFRGEEDYWIGAMEWMDSLGTRIINTSLGYSLGFDDKKENYSPAEMNGATAAISKAAQIAVDEKGLLLIVSAGNEGNNSAWQIVSAPADAQGVVSVGATNKMGVKAGYSSIGPEELPYLKPDISCFSDDGTSFSAPIITGFAACLMQLNPKATNKQLIAVMHQSAQLYRYGNNHIGYGIPQGATAINLMNGKEANPAIAKKEAFGKAKVTIKIEGEEKGRVIVFHKIGERQVIRSQVIRYNKGKLKLQKLKGIERTTVLLEDHTGIEIFWKKP